MNYQVIEYAVRCYIDKKGYLKQKRDYNLSIKSSGYIFWELLCVCRNR